MTTGKSFKSKISNASVFGKVAVVMGGASAEREVSLKSGNAVLTALKNSGVDAHAFDADVSLLRRMQEANVTRVFIALHGKGGEDGLLQGALETLGIPYTGTGVLGSALGMDKLRSKYVWRGLNLPTPDFVVVDSKNPKESIAIAQQMRMPVIVKPSTQGSSIGMAKVTDAWALPEACKNAQKFDPVVLVEQWVTGAEYTASILDDQALPLIRLETPRAFYDYEAKYFASDTRYLCPCGLPADAERNIQNLALQAFGALGCTGWGRVDVMCDQQGQPYFLEVNTVPGMTDHSLVPMAARAAGLSFDALCWKILESSLSRG